MQTQEFETHPWPTLQSFTEQQLPSVQVPLQHLYPELQPPLFAQQFVTSLGQLAEEPVQFSAGSHVSAEARH